VVQSILLLEWWGGWKRRGRWHTDATLEANAELILLLLLLRLRGVREVGRWVRLEVSSGG
jgi:hypothetical protein